MLTFVAVFALVLAYIALVAAYLALRTLAKVRRSSTVLSAGGDGRESILQASARHVEWTSALAVQVEALRSEVAATRTEIAALPQVEFGALSEQLQQLDAATRQGFASRDARLDATTASLESRLTSEVARADALLDARLTGIDNVVRESLTQMDADVARSLRNVALVRFDAFDDMAGRLSFSLALLDDQGDGVTLTSLAGRADTRLFAKGVHAGTGEHDLAPEEQQAIAAARQSAAEHRTAAEQAGTTAHRSRRGRRGARQHTQADDGTDDNRRAG